MTKKIQDIEVLRGIAVLFVCVEHMHMNLFAWVPGQWHQMFYGWSGMWSGVDLFFVISGFVIARDLVPRLAATGSTHERLVVSVAFWIRRAWRLIPSAWWGLGVIPVSYTHLRAHETVLDLVFRLLLEKNKIPNQSNLVLIVLSRT
mgnify:CR=1 FL=1